MEIVATRKIKFTGCKLLLSTSAVKRNCHVPELPAVLKDDIERNNISEVRRLPLFQGFTKKRAPT